MGVDPLEGVNPVVRQYGVAPIERHCLSCRSVEFQAGLDTYQCLRCGARQYVDGTPVMEDPLCLVPSEANKGARGVESPDQLYDWDDLMKMEHGGKPRPRSTAAEVEAPAAPDELVGVGDGS